MDMISVCTAVLELAAGIGVFLIACGMMSSNLESVSSGKLKELFSRSHTSGWIGVGIGTVGTAAIQSSGAMTVMVIGFVNAGIMNLAQAATIIYGANIGTTVTGQIVALGMFGGNSISTTAIFSAFAGVGAFMQSFGKRDIIRKTGGILAGFGMLFVGLSMMSGSMESFARLDSVKNALASVSSPALLVLIGTVLTAIVQSSSVTTSISIAMVVTGLISLDQGIYMTLGSNVGACVVGIIAGFTSGTQAKRTAMISLLFKAAGAAVFLLAAYILLLVSGGRWTYGALFERLFPNAPQTQLAMFHTIFNVIVVLGTMPLTDRLVALVTRMIREPVVKHGDGPEQELRLYYLDEHMLKTPPIALAQMKSEIVNMADIAMRNFTLALDTICRMDFSELKTMQANEAELDFLLRELINFAVRLSEQQMSHKDRVYLSSTYHSASDLERVGDYAENILEYAQFLQETGEHFSNEAVSEIVNLRSRIEELFQQVLQAYLYEDELALARAAQIEDTIDDMTDLMAVNHIRRLSEGVCTSNVGSQFLSLNANCERIADHFMNIGNTIKRRAQ